MKARGEIFLGLSRIDVSNSFSHNGGRVLQQLKELVLMWENRAKEKMCTNVRTLYDHRDARGAYASL